MIPESYIDLLMDGHVAHLATINPDGTPQVSPIWVDYSDGLVLFNTAKLRKKYRNIKKNPNVALSIPDKSNPYRYITIQGIVVEEEENQKVARDHIATLGVRYFDKEFIPPEEEVRVIFKIKPKYVHTSG